jgi:hypothetical protein
MPMVTVYMCRTCKEQLDARKTYLSQPGVLQIDCVRCKTPVIVAVAERCGLCEQTATNLTLGRGRSGTTRRICRCDVHRGCDDISDWDKTEAVSTFKRRPTVFRCVECATETSYSSAELAMSSGTLRAVCPQCKTTLSLQTSLECQICRKPAEDIVASQAGSSEFRLRCREHVGVKQKFCFLATAACGSPHAAEVIVLQEYRDSVLRATATGRWFVRLYETFSPPLARVVAASRVGRKVTRSLLVAPCAAWAEWRLRVATRHAHGNALAAVERASDRRSHGS